MKRIIAVGRILRGGRVEMVTAHDAATAAMDADLAELVSSGWEPVPSAHDGRLPKFPSRRQLPDPLNISEPTKPE